MLEFKILAGKNHRYDIEPRFKPEIILEDIGFGRINQALHFNVGHRFRRMFIPESVAGFHLNNDQRIPLPGHNIEFKMPVIPVGIQHPPPLF